MSINSQLKTEAVSLLKSLIATPSFSKSEDNTAAILIDFFTRHQVPVNRSNNNVWVSLPSNRPNAPTLLLNSHHDTVKPVDGWQRNPFEGRVEDGVLYGLGSNDAGASLVSLAAVFLHFYQNKDLPCNLIYLASAEEEISGKLGVASVLPQLGEIDLAIVGEPTQTHLAIAEKGLMVIDGVAHGKAGHAAREEGENAIYIALKDIDLLRHLAFEKKSAQLGGIKISVTQIHAGTQHNVVPDACSFVVDVRTTDPYTNQEVFDILQENTQSTLTARSFRLNPSGIPVEHPIVQAGLSIGLTTFGSATLSDQALMPFPTLKMGPGDSKRSHTADEFIVIQEIYEGIDRYIQLLDHYFLQKTT